MPLVKIPGSTQSAEVQPYFQHDCTECVYLGSAEINTCKADFYYCEKAFPTLVYRTGDEPPNYGSCWINQVSPLSPFATLALALYVRHLNASGANGFFCGSFFKDGQIVLKVNAL